MDLNNRSILLTGAGSGIGRALALELAQHGFDYQSPEEVASAVRRSRPRIGSMTPRSVPGRGAAATRIETGPW